MQNWCLLVNELSPMEFHGTFIATNTPCETRIKHEVFWQGAFSICYHVNAHFPACGTPNTFAFGPLSH